MWFTLALASSVFAALTSILAKIGIDTINTYFGKDGGQCRKNGRQNSKNHPHSIMSLFLSDWYVQVIYLRESFLAKDSVCFNALSLGIPARRSLWA